MQLTDDEPQVLTAPRRLDAESRPEFRRAVLAELERAITEGATRVTLDLGQTTAIDASGLGVLLLLQRRASERMVVTRLLHATEAVRRILRLTKLDHLFELED